MTAPDFEDEVRVALRHRADLAGHGGAGAGRAGTGASRRVTLLADRRRPSVAWWRRRPSPPRSWA